MHHPLRIVHGSPTAAELAAVTAVLSAVVYGTVAGMDGHHRVHRAHRPDWDRAWRPHPVPHSWCTRGHMPFHRP
ncbi:acyl-CoA carboxylase subunit epsilon [Streptomyces sp. CC77]|uniref:acyl-CoA carboxylase subunit epsilon n=1 Tax=Streptomyces sp. CC77 TaxID=1906739 RepID=UPI000D1B80B1|nr:acyl-CoA carboxylase subunit epsilon [Streptomyces sp. CC77]